MWHPVVGMELARQRRETILTGAERVGRGSRRQRTGGWRKLVGMALVAAGQRMLRQPLEAR